MPELHTMIKCSKCGQMVRASKHTREECLESQIKQLSDSYDALLATHQETINICQKQCDENKQLQEELESRKDLEEKFESLRADYSKSNQQLKAEKKQLEDELENLKIRYDNKGHIPELGFKNGKAYCKKCGSSLE